MKSLFTFVIACMLSVLCFAQTSTQVTIADPNSGFFVFWGISTTSDTGLILSGISDFPNAALLKTDHQLHTEWYKIYPGIWEFDYATETPDHGFIALGKTVNGKLVLMKTDSLGVVQWTSIRSTGSTDGSGRIQVLPSGKYLLASDGAGGLMMACADTNGTILWEKNYGVTVDATNFRYAEPTTEHGWIVCGTYLASGGTCLMKTDSLGNILWQRSLAPGTHGFSVHADNNGYFLSAQSSAAHLAVRTDTSGNVLWARQWPLLYSSNISEYNFPVVQNGNELLCYGNRYVGMLAYPMMISFDPAGNVLWTKYYNTNFTNAITGGNVSIINQENKIIFLQIENSHNSNWLIEMDTTGEAVCNEINATLAVTPFTVSMGTATVNPTVNTNPWSSLSIVDSIGTTVVSVVCDPLSVETEVVNEVTVYPNPATDVLFVRGAERQARFVLTNALGQVVFVQILSGGGVESIEITQLPQGVYFYSITDEASVASGKLIRN